MHSNKLKYLALALLPVFAAQAFVPGEVVKGSGPKVYVIENDQRHWIPDPPTLIQK